MIRIVIAEDQRMLRGALASLLDLEDDLEVVGQAGDGAGALALIETLRPDVCLMDIEMPLMSGLEVAEKLQAQGSPCRVIILTTFARPGYFERAVKTGVQGYLLKDESSDRLAEAIRRVMAGHREASPELVFGSLRRDNPLTAREQEILRLAAEGRTAGEIAGSLHLSYGTVRNYISEVLNKLEVKTRIEAVRLAEENGWI
ncbi:Transcriptional regulatory protein DegU [compost metagenome]|uniref:Response regulator transcription factor n=1 Tax=Paenibacillus rhizolycopersici TaxID=2780073 RepID=A0ABS2H4X2_9BACL|nr:MULTISPECIES: response regulator transcription factor [Paenibacillus]MBM6995836.1 response regulator transcription factor [Paenibacillus rhizolycopersici]MUG87214.1 response regulator [Paenibacillus timonensis]GIP48939.1 DNA-binding response regulator [Paenibacillus sp. J53TS2]